jgi:hypothetical protein
VISWLKRLSVLVAVPENFYLLTHKTETGFQIVEPKDIQPQIPIVWSPLYMFFHEALVDHLLKSKAEVERVQRAHIFRESNGFISDDYFTLSIRNQWSLTMMMQDDFRPALINLVDGLANCVFFSRDYYNLVSSETNLVFQESPTISLIPLGKGE